MIDQNQSGLVQFGGGGEFGTELEISCFGAGVFTSSVPKKMPLRKVNKRYKKLGL